MKFIVLFIISAMCIYRSFCIQGKYSKNIQNGTVVYPVRVTKDGNYIDDLDLRFKRSKASHEPTTHYRISIEEKAEYIDLKPNTEIFSPGAVLELRTNDSTFPDQLSNIKAKLLSDQQCIYTGKVRGYEDSNIALSTCDGLCGLIRIKRKTFLVEPLCDNASSSKENPHVIYEQINVKRHFPNCAVNGPYSSKQKTIKHSRNRRRSSVFKKAKLTLPRSSYNSSPLHLESLVVIDSAMVKRHLSGNDLENYVMTILNMAQSLLHDLNLEPSINFELVRMVQLLDDSEEINLGKEKSAEEHLKMFSEWQDIINPKSEEHPNHHDIAILLTGNDICDINGNCHYLGIAERNGICRSKRVAAVCKDNGLLLGYTLAHEIAHNLGIEHDTGLGKHCSPLMPDGSSSIMNPTISLSANEWSKCSQDSLKHSIESGFLSCLEDDTTALSTNHMDLLPGVIYGGDLQCQRLYTPGASECNNEGDCQSLKCQLKGTACSNTGLLPAPGTSCGENKWCYEGECVEAGNRPETVHGGWSLWSEWGSCSRSCGSGISVSTRECNNPVPRHGGKMCSGRRKRHKVCSTEPCPVGSISFRDFQCAEYNSWIFPEDKKSHKWKGFFISNGNPCALTCKNENDVVVSLAPEVIDGTTCYRGLRDICIDGVCRGMPCDLQFDSNSVEDACGICHGNGTECRIVQGTKTFEGLSNIIPSLPKGTRNIKMKVLKPTKSHILVKAVDNKELFNDGGKLGMFKVPGSVAWVGMIKPKQEILEIPGPIDQPISIWVTSEGSQTVAYSLGMPSQPRKGVYSWDYINWLPCKAQCGDGYQEAEPKCVEIMSGHVEDKYCNEIEKPRVKRRPCSTGPCYAKWLIGEWQECGPCPSSEAKRFRLVQCIKPIAGMEEGTAFVPSKECPGSRPASSEHCPCLKRQAKYWPPHYRSYSSSSHIQNVLLNSHIRKIRSTKTPEKKVTLMQLENESEESMLKQFKENQHKHYPFLFMPSLFGTRFNFTIPLKKRQARFPVNHHLNCNKDLIERIIDYNPSLNSLIELEKYPEQLLSMSSIPQPSPDKVNPYDYADANDKVNGPCNIAEFNPVNTHLKGNITKYIRPMHTYLHKTTLSPLHFSDQKILKLLSDNLALQKLKQHQDLKVINKPHYKFLPPKFENDYDKRNFDFLNVISNQLYRTLEMQAYLQSLMNLSKEKNNMEPFKVIPSEIVLQPVKNEVKMPSKGSSLPFMKETKLHYEMMEPFSFTNLKQSKNCKARPEDDIGSEGVDIHSISNRKLNNDVLTNGLKLNTRYSGIGDLLQKKENKPYNASIFRLPDMNLIFESTRLIQDPSVKQSQNSKPNTCISLNLQEFANKENKLVDKIINKLIYLPHEGKERLHHDLVYITEYLKYLLSLDSINKVGPLDEAEKYKETGSFLRNEIKDINFDRSYIQEDDNSHKENGQEAILFKNNFKNGNWINHRDLPETETINRLLDKLNNLNDENLNKEYNDLNSYSSQMHTEDEFYNPKDFLRNSSLNVSHSFENNLINKMKQYEDVLNRVKTEQIAEIYGPLKFIYPIPEGRLCNYTSTTAKCGNISPCRIKRGALKVPISSFQNAVPYFPQQNASLQSAYISVNIVPQAKSFRVFNSSIKNEMSRNLPKILQSSINNLSFNVNESEFDSPKYDHNSKNNEICDSSLTVPETTKLNAKNDSFYNPPKFDFVFDTKHVNCQDDLMYELQKELQLTRHRNCTQCYYLYKDQTTLRTMCKRHQRHF